MTYKDALDYFNYAEKQGIEYDLEGMSEKEMIDLAGKMMDAADAAYDAWKEEFGTEYDENGCDPGGHPNSEVMAERLNI